MPASLFSYVVLVLLYPNRYLSSIIKIMIIITNIQKRNTFLLIFANRLPSFLSPSPGSLSLFLPNSIQICPADPKPNPQYLPKPIKPELSIRRGLPLASKVLDQVQCSRKSSKNTQASRAASVYGDSSTFSDKDNWSSRGFFETLALQDRT